MLTDAVLFLSGCFFFPTAFKLICHLSRNFLKDKSDERIVLTVGVRLVSTIQAICAFTSGIIIITSCKDVLHDSHWLTSKYIIFASSYFYYDTWAMYQLFWYKNPEIQGLSFSRRVSTFMMKQPVMMIHHLIFPVIYFPVIVYFRGNVGDFFVGCFYCIEFSVPFLSLRGILVELKMENTLLYYVNGVLLLFTFTLCRVLIFPFMYWCLAQQKGVPLLQSFFTIPIKCNIGCFGIFAVQVYWLHQMLSIFASTIWNKWVKKLIQESDAEKVS